MTSGNKVLAYLTGRYAMSAALKALWLGHSRGRDPDMQIEAIERAVNSPLWRKWGCPEPGDCERAYRDLEREARADQRRVAALKEAKHWDGKKASPKEAARRRRLLRSDPFIRQLLEQREENNGKP